MYKDEQPADLSDELAVSFRVPQTFALLSRAPPLPLPRASKLPEKLIICHIASVLRHTLKRSSRRNSPVGPLNPVLDAAPATEVGPRTYGAILMCFSLFGRIQRGHLRRVSFSLWQQSMGQCSYSFPLQPKYSSTDARCAITDLFRPLPSSHPPNNMKEGWLGYPLFCSSERKLVALKAVSFSQNSVALLKYSRKCHFCLLVSLISSSTTVSGV